MRDPLIGVILQRTQKARKKRKTKQQNKDPQKINSCDAGDH